MKRLWAGELIAGDRWFIVFLMIGLMVVIADAPALRAANGAGAALQETQPSEAGTPEVTSIDPPGAVRGSAVMLKVTGRNFGKGAKISFANTDIRVMETNDLSPTELTARIQVAPKAATGTTSLYVTNPNYRQAELPFQVAEGTITGTSIPAASATPTPSDLSFEVMHIQGKKILTPTKLKGILSYSKGKLRFEESGQEIFVLTPADIKEIDLNMVLGVSAGSFHIILKTGKKYDFVAASMKAPETKFISDSLKRAVH